MGCLSTSQLFNTFETLKWPFAHHTLTHICPKECVSTMPQLSEETKVDPFPEPREQPGVGGVGGEEERGRVAAWRGGGKTNLEGRHLALQLRGLDSKTLSGSPTEMNAVELRKLRSLPRPVLGPSKTSLCIQLVSKKQFLANFCQT